MKDSKKHKKSKIWDYLNKISSVVEWVVAHLSERDPPRTKNQVNQIIISVKSLSQPLLLILQREHLGFPLIFFFTLTFIVIVENQVKSMAQSVSK